MAEYRHAMVDDRKGGKIVFPPFVSQNEIDVLQKSFRTENNDVFVVAYPKSGTTWLEQIVHLLLNGGRQGDLVLSKAVPWLEGSAQRYGGFDNLFSNHVKRRKFHTHLPFSLMPDFVDGSPKYLYIARNPKDNAVSFYFHSCSKMGYEGSWNEFFELYIAGKVGYGSFFDHVTDWWHASQRFKNIKFLYYEDLKEKLSHWVVEIAKFIDLNPSKDLTESVVEESTFGRMANNSKANLDWVPQKEGIPKHMRKGEIGDWKNHFSAEQSQRMDELIQSRFSSTDISFEFGQK